MGGLTADAVESREGMAAFPLRDTAASGGGHAEGVGVSLCQRHVPWTPSPPFSLALLLGRAQESTGRRLGFRFRSSKR
jgi:predicted oxidoreductase